MSEVMRLPLLVVNGMEIPPKADNLLGVVLVVTMTIFTVAPGIRG